MSCIDEALDICDKLQSQGKYYMIGEICDGTWGVIHFTDPSTLGEWVKTFLTPSSLVNYLRGLL